MASVFYILSVINSCKNFSSYLIAAYVLVVDSLEDSCWKPFDYQIRLCDPVSFIYRVLHRITDSFRLEETFKTT